MLGEPSSHPLVGPGPLERVRVETIVLRPRCGHLRDNLRRPYALAGEEFRLDASVGVACFPRDGRTPEELLRHADLAMYAAKRANGAQPA